jgi:transcriptional repressor NrdR
MKCPYCDKTNTRVLDKRDDHNLGVTRRRRECEVCRKRFTTFERVELIHLVVLKKNGTRQAFDRSKVMSGVLSATWKRGIEQERLELLVNEIELELRKRETLEIPSIEIGNMVMKKLKELDNVAYIRFASIYRAFADVGDFQRELSMLLHSQPVVAT